MKLDFSTLPITELTSHRDNLRSLAAQHRALTEEITGLEQLQLDTEAKSKKLSDSVNLMDAKSVEKAATKNAGLLFTLQLLPTHQAKKGADQEALNATCKNDIFRACIKADSSCRAAIALLENKYGEEVKPRCKTEAQAEKLVETMLETTSPAIEIRATVDKCHTADDNFKQHFTPEYIDMAVDALDDLIGILAPETKAA